MNANTGKPNGKNTLRISKADQAKHLKWVLGLTSIPTAAGREHRVIRWIESWVNKRPGLHVIRDHWGNVLVKPRSVAWPSVLFTAHLDHPAFVITKIVDDRTLEAEFRGGVMPVYFVDGKVRIWDDRDRSIAGRIVEHHKGRVFDEVTIRLSRSLPGSQSSLPIATWDIPPAQVIRGRIHAPACDDLAGAAAAISALDVLQGSGSEPLSVGLLFTRAEEVGFLGAILACDSGFIPQKSKVIALENSRSFAESPIGAGPIVRVGDKMSIFHHGLTYAISQIADENAKTNPNFKWQRKLMPGGTCEATAYFAYGYEATCLCLPLGNYHNMGDLDAVIAGTNRTKPRAAAEIVSVSDYHGLVELLVACGHRLASGSQGQLGLDGAQAILNRLHSIRDEKRFVLEDSSSALVSRSESTRKPRQGMKNAP